MPRSASSHASIHDDATAQKLVVSGRHHRGTDSFQPVRAAVRTGLGPGLVRDRLSLGALPQSGFEGEEGPGQYRKAEARPNHLRDRA